MNFEDVPTSLGDQNYLAEAILGGGLPEEAEICLWRAAEVYADSAAAEEYLRQAETHAPDHAAVLIGFYRFYFYKGRLREALSIAERCLVKAARENNFSIEWRLVNRDDAIFDSYDAVLPRFYLFTLKGYAYLKMRLGEIDESREAVMKLQELDPTDKIGAKVLLGVLDRIGVSDDD